MTINEGKTVSFDYTLTVDGEIVDSSKDRGPFQYTHGKGQIIPGLSKRLEGLTKDDEKTIDVPAQEAYGEVNPEAFREIPKTALPTNIEPKVGMLLQMKGEGDQTLTTKVSAVNNDTIVLDLNHPLAGKALTFQVKIVSIE